MISNSNNTLKNAFWLRLLCIAALTMVMGNGWGQNCWSGSNGCINNNGMSVPEAQGMNMSEKRLAFFNNDKSATGARVVIANKNSWYNCINSFQSWDNEDVTVLEFTFGITQSTGQKTVKFSKFSYDRGDGDPWNNNVSSINNLSPGTYYWAVRVGNNWGQSCFSSAKSFTVPDNGAGKPNLISSDEDLDINSFDNIDIEVTVKNEGSQTADESYICYYLSDNTTITKKDIFIEKSYVEELSSGETSDESINFSLYDFKEDLDKGDNYYIGYIIDCEEDVSESSGNDNTGYFNNTVTPDEPDEPEIHDIDVGDGWAEIDWYSVDNAKYYKVYRDNSIIDGNVTSSDYTDNDVTNGEEHCYEVKACNGFGCSSSSSDRCGTPEPDKPDAPADHSFESTPGNGYVDLDWEGVTGADEYKVYRDDKVIATVDRAEYRDNDVEGCADLCYYIKACNLGGCSDPTEEQCVTVKDDEGTLKIVLEPGGVGQWKIDGVTQWLTGGIEILPVGDYTVQFREESGYSAPSPETVTITSCEQLTRTFKYISSGPADLQVSGDFGGDLTSPHYRDEEFRTSVKFINNGGETWSGKLFLSFDKDNIADGAVLADFDSKSFVSLEPGESVTLSHIDWNGFSSSAGDYYLLARSYNKSEGHRVLRERSIRLQDHECKGPNPSRPSASNITETSASINWSGSSASYVIAYREQGTTTWNESNFEVTPPFTLSGLSPGTYYEMSIGHVCPGNGSCCYSSISTLVTKGSSGGGGGGCKSPSNFSLRANGTATSSITISEGDVLNLDITDFTADGYNYNWFLDNNFLNSSSETQHTTSSLGEGTYNFEVSASKFNCNRLSELVTVTVEASGGGGGDDCINSIGITANGSNQDAISLTEGESLSMGVLYHSGYNYSWFKDGSKVGNGTTYQEALGVGIYDFQVVASKSGCNAPADQVTVTVEASGGGNDCKNNIFIKANNSPNSSITLQEGQPLDLESTNYQSQGYSYRWFKDGAIISSGSNTYSASDLEAGRSYIFKVVASKSGCSPPLEDQVTATVEASGGGGSDPLGCVDVGAIKVCSDNTVSKGSGKYSADGNVRIYHKDASENDFHVFANGSIDINRNDLSTSSKVQVGVNNIPGFPNKLKLYEGRMDFNVVDNTLNRIQNHANNYFKLNGLPMEVSKIYMLDNYSGIHVDGKFKLPDFWINEDWFELTALRLDQDRGLTAAGGVSLPDNKLNINGMPLGARDTKLTFNTVNEPAEYTAATTISAGFLGSLSGKGQIVEVGNTGRLNEVFLEYTLAAPAPLPGLPAIAFEAAGLGAENLSEEVRKGGETLKLDGTATFISSDGINTKIPAVRIEGGAKYDFGGQFSMTSELELFNQKIADTKFVMNPGVATTFEGNASIFWNVINGNTQSVLGLKPGSKGMYANGRIEANLEVPSEELRNNLTKGKNLVVKKLIDYGFNKIESNLKEFESHGAASVKFETQPSQDYSYAGVYGEFNVGDWKPGLLIQWENPSGFKLSDIESDFAKNYKNLVESEGLKELADKDPTDFESGVGFKSDFSFDFDPDKEYVQFEVTDPTQQVVVSLLDESATEVPQFSIIYPDNKSYKGGEDRENVGYLESTPDYFATAFLNNPRPGLYLVEMDKDYTTNVMAKNTTPQIDIVDVTHNASNQSIKVKWDAEDPDNNADIRFGLDIDQEGMNGITIKEGIKEDGPNELTIEYDSIGTGDYYLYGYIEDAVNSFSYDYSEKSIRIVRKNGPQSPKNLRYELRDSLIHLEWDSTYAENMGFHIYYETGETDVTLNSPSFGVARFPHTNNGSLLAPGRKYSIMVTAIDLEGKESEPSNIVKVDNYNSRFKNNHPWLESVDGYENTQSNTNYNKQLVSHENDGDKLRYDLISGPSDMTISQDGTIEWNPTTKNIGFHTIRAKVKDGKGGSDSIRYTLRVMGSAQKEADIMFGAPVYYEYNKKYILTVNDIDFKGNPNKVDVLNVELFSSSSDNVVTYELKETGSNSLKFSGNFSLSPTGSNGTVAAKSGDTLFATYDDPSSSKVSTISFFEKDKKAEFKMDKYGFCGSSDTVRFFNQSYGTDLKYYWDFGDGSTSSERHPTHYYENMDPGTYTVSLLIVDRFGDSTSVNKNIRISVPKISFVKKDVTCHNAQNGSITLTPSGGIKPYQYKWIPDVSKTNKAISLKAGNYSVGIADSAGCVVWVDSIQITQPLPLSVRGQTDQPICHGQTGGVTLHVEGGSPPYSFEWSNGSQDSIITGLQGGSHSVTVTDAKGCTKQKTFLIRDLAPLQVDFQTQNFHCTAADSARITAQVSGGIPPYNYEWNNGSQNASISGILTTSYQLLVTDSLGCTQYFEGIWADTSKVSYQTKNVSCHGSADGSITVDVEGGQPPYTFKWSNNGPNSPQHPNLTPGEYQVFVYDKTGCIDTRSFEITQPKPLVISGESTPVTCWEGNDGAIQTSAQGGTPPYTYNWQHGPSTRDINNLQAGNYILTVSDQNGCETTQSFLLTEPDSLEFNTLEIRNPSCFNGKDGKISVEGAGGVPPYTFIWNNDRTTPTIDNLDAHNREPYTVTITDSRGCQKSRQYQIEEPAQAPELTYTFPRSEPYYCQADTNPLPELKYADHGKYTAETGLELDSESGRINIQASKPGSYTVRYVISGAQCPVPEQELTIAQPESPAFKLERDTFCHKGLTQIEVLGTPGGTFSAPNALELDPKTGQIDLEASTPGTYRIQYATPMCQVISKKPITILSEPVLTIEAQTPTKFCRGETFQYQIIHEGESYPYSVSYQVGEKIKKAKNQFGDTISLEDIPDSNQIYQLNAIEYNHCIQSVFGKFIETTVYQLPILSDSVITIPENCGNKDGQIKVPQSLVNSTSRPLLFSLNGRLVQQDTVFRNLEAGQYWLDIFDSKECNYPYPYPIKVKEAQCPLDEVPNMITPNGDGRNDVWEVEQLQYYPNCTVQIYDRWGNTVKTYNNGYNEPWTGEGQKTGTYYYVITINEETKPISGYVDLVR